MERRRRADRRAASGLVFRHAALISSIIGPETTAEAIAMFTRLRPSLLTLGSLCAWILLFPALGSAQLAPPSTRPAPRPAAATPTTKADKADAEADKQEDVAEKHLPGGAALKTDPEQQRLLKRAEQCVEDGRLDLAAVLWQKVLDEAGD